MDRLKHAAIAAVMSALVVAGMTLPFGIGGTAKAGAPPRPTVTVTRTVTATATVTQTVTATATATVTQTVTATPTSTDSATPTVTPSVTPTVTPTATTTPPAGGFPTLASAGTPDGWTPVQTINGDHRVTTAGALVQDLRINGDLIIDAANVRVNRVEIVGGVINNWPGSVCRNGLVVENTTIKKGGPTGAGGTPAFGQGGYTARNVLIDGLPEGFRAGGKSGGCTAVVIENSYANIVRPDTCGDWHGDALQGYDGPAVTVTNSVFILNENGCGGTAPFFVPSGQGNTSATVDGLIVEGGGYPFRLGTPGSVNNLHIVDGSWGYGPIAVQCNLLTSWQASISTVGADGQPTVVRAQPCNTSDGS